MLLLLSISSCIHCILSFVSELSVAYLKLYDHNLECIPYIRVCTVDIKSWGDCETLPIAVSPTLPNLMFCGCAMNMIK